MSATEHKALTYINLPFIGDDGTGKRFEPGKMIPREDFEAYAQACARLPESIEDPSPVHTADSIIEELTKYGSLSDDPDAPLHPDNTVPKAGEVTVQSLVAQAEALVERLEAEGKDVPAKLRAVTEISDKQISTADSAAGRDHLVSDS